MNIKLKCVCAILSPLVLLSVFAQAQDIGTPDPESMGGLSCHRNPNTTMDFV